MKILIADRLPSFVNARLSATGADVEVDPSLKGDTLLEKLVTFQPNVLIVRSTRVQSEHFDASKNLELVVRAGAGVNTIDLDAASSKAVSVCNCPGMNAVAVAELAMGHIINADRRISDNVADLRVGVWAKKEYSKAQGLKGRTIGVVGAGAIARAMIKRARAFEMDVACYAPNLNSTLAGELGVEATESVLDLASRVSILTVHVPLNESTRHLVDASVMAKMPDGAIIINTSRGGVVDEVALRDAVETRDFRAGLDVFETEPAADGAFRSFFADTAGVYGTHHIGASTQQAQDAVAAEACRVVEMWLQTGEAPNWVNIRRISLAKEQLIIRHLDRVGVLARVFDTLRAADINIQDMRNVIYSGENGAACAQIKVVGAVTEELLATIASSDDVLDVKRVHI